MDIVSALFLFEFVVLIDINTYISVIISCILFGFELKRFFNQSTLCKDE